VVPAPAALDYGNRTVVNFQRVPGYPFEINTCIQAAVYHISDTPSKKLTYKNKCKFIKKHLDFFFQC